MTPQDLMKQNVESAFNITKAYVGDLTDAELFVRPVPGANHTAWNLGHLIAGTHWMLTALGHAPPPLPAGFDTAYTRETAASDDPAKFAAKAEYLALAEQMKTATLAAIAATPASSLEAPGPERMRAFAPTVAATLMAAGNHWLMHAGQFVIVRRKLGKPIMF